MLDTYDNSTHAYLVDGDGILDADNDSNGFVNDGGSDPKEYITFTIDKTDASNWKIVEQKAGLQHGIHGRHDRLGGDLRARHLFQRSASGQ